MSNTNDKYYNAGNKLKFLDVFKKTCEQDGCSENNIATKINRISSLFKELKHYEQIIKLDVSNFNLNMITLSLSSIMFKSSCNSNAAKTKFDILLQYVKWCAKDDDSIDIALWNNIKVEDLNTPQIAKGKYYKDKFEFLDCMLYFYSPNSDMFYNKTVNKVYFVATLLSYNGVPLEKVSTLNLDDINFKDRIITYNNASEKIQIDMIDEFIPYYRNVYDVREYTINCKQRVPETVTEPLKLISSPEVTSDKIYKRCLQKLSDINVNKDLLSVKNKVFLKQSTVEFSSLFYKMYIIERNSGSVNIDDYNPFKLKTANAKDFEREYSLYKQAFYSEFLY